MRPRLGRDGEPGGCRAQNTVGAGSDTLTGIENLTGSSFNDVLTGDAGATC
jgi:Ca2+-binding RTX toxin-like protein